VYDVIDVTCFALVISCRRALCRFMWVIHYRCFVEKQCQVMSLFLFSYLGIIQTNLHNC